MRNEGSPSERLLPAAIQWTTCGRILIFVLAATSIWCLLAEMYGLSDMRTLTFSVLLPATFVLYGMALFDRARGDRRLWRAVIIGTISGLVGAIGYDIFRLPFVFSDAWGMGDIGIPQMPLFKVFPRFGALILGEAPEQAYYTRAAHVIGWTYHFSNGAMFGVMFASMIGTSRRSWGAICSWAVIMALGIEFFLLMSPYTRFFNIHANAQFVAATIAAHVVFGIGLGLSFGWQSRLWPSGCTTGGPFPGKKFCKISLEVFDPAR